MLGLDGSRLPGDLVDGRFPGYVLEHGWLWLTGREPGFWNAPFYYPMSGVIALSDSLAGALPVYAVLRALAPTPEQAMVGLVIALFLLNFALAVVFLRGCGVGLGVAAVAAYPVAFGLFVAAQAGRVHCLQLYPVLLGLLALWRFLAAPSPARAHALAGAATLLALTSFYYCVFFLLLAAVATLLALAVGLVRLEAIGRALKPQPAGLAFWGCCVLLVATLYWPHYRASLETGAWSEQQAGALAPSLAGLWAPPHGSVAWGWLEGLVAANPEERLFPGLVPLVGLGFGLWCLAGRRRDKAAVLAGLLALAAVLVVVAFLDVWGPRGALGWLPGVSSLRVTTRVAVLAVPCAGLGLALLLDRVARRLRPGWAGAFLVAALAVVAADQYVRPEAYPSHAWRPARERVEVLARSVPGPARVFYVQPAAPSGEPEYWAVHLDAMLAAQRLGKATYNGYSSWLPPELGLFYDQGTCESLDAWRNVAVALYAPGTDWHGLYADSAFLGRSYCPPDPKQLSRPQGRHLRPLSPADRRVAIRAEASFAQGSRTLRLDAAIRNLGHSALNGLGDYSHRGAVFLVAEVYDATGHRTTVPLTRLDRSIRPGETVTQHGETVLGNGLEPKRLAAALIQAPDGVFSVTADAPIALRLEP
ncbi:MAG: hypothetical protein ACP59X_15920 [Solidesulfovibrio sp. DCME]|uniref:hypothetical protein n=1 Tax=Solidesulfovibrio sp. DCME TaxID=3447380 RepID=UPI003D0E9FAD